MTALIPKHGIVQHVPMNYYHSLPSINSSKIADAFQSAAFYNWKHNLKKIAEEHSDALEFGQAMHTALLEPDIFKSKKVILPDFGDQRSPTNREKKQKFFAQLPEGAITLTEQDAETITEMLKVLLGHAKIPNMLNAGISELSAFWSEDGVDYRARADYISQKNKLLIDYKTTKDASVEGFAREVIKYNYQLKMAHYKRGFEMNGFKIEEVSIIAQEKKPPYHVNVFYLDPYFLECGEEDRQIGIKRIIEGNKNGNWIGYTEEIKHLTAPSWYVFQRENQV